MFPAQCDHTCKIHYHSCLNMIEPFVLNTERVVQAYPTGSGNKMCQIWSHCSSIAFKPNILLAHPWSMKVAFIHKRNYIIYSSNLQNNGKLILLNRIPFYTVPLLKRKSFGKIRLFLFKHQLNLAERTHRQELPSQKDQCTYMLNWL